eukprot:1359512-Pyramimonas_sp.AAC.1
MTTSTTRHLAPTAMPHWLLCAFNCRSIAKRGWAGEVRHARLRPRAECLRRDRAASEVIIFPPPWH